MSGPARTSGRRRWGIGEVVATLRSDFPEISISKIRFLEAEGLVRPERTPAGYRKFSQHEVERLRYILAAQRDRYLPLKVIAEHLDAMDRGLEPPEAAGESARPPGPSGPHTAPPTAAEFAAEPWPALRMSRAELLANSGLTDEQLVSFMSFGLIEAVAGTDFFDADALTVATTVAEMSAYGLEPRHLRTFKSAAQREVGLIEQVLSPVASHRSDDAQDRAAQAVAHLGALSVRLHACLVRIGLRHRTAPVTPE